MQVCLLRLWALPSVWSMALGTRTAPKVTLGLSDGESYTWTGENRYEAAAKALWDLVGEDA